MIYLLDLNYTLVDKEKDAPRIRPMELQIELETYRQWLIDMLKGKYVILTTARMQKYEIFTLNRIYTKTNWLPNESFFSIFRHLPHIKKEWILKWRIFPKHGNNPEQFFAIESNPKPLLFYDQSLIFCRFKFFGCGISSSTFTSLSYAHHTSIPSAKIRALFSSAI